jgi:hypothetical protein
MVLVDLDDKPIEIPGSTIRQLKDEGVLKLYQTHFRLVCEDGSWPSPTFGRPDVS